MTKDVNDLKDEKNPYFQEIKDNLNSFIENINSIRESYYSSIDALEQRLKNAEASYDDFVAQYSVATKEGGVDYNIPKQFIHTYRAFCKKKAVANRAISIIPPSYIVSLISAYDVFLTGLIRSIFKLCPEKLNSSEKQFFYKDFCSFNSVDEIKQNIVDKIIEDLLRKSHVEQFEWLEKSLSINTLKKFGRWGQFVELTERRNLFVHCGGVVSPQYIDECRKVNSVPKGVVKGSKLNVDNIYFIESYKLLYNIAVSLTAIITNKLFLPRFGDNSSDVDVIFIENIYELISEKFYDVAIELSDFAFSPSFKHNAIDKSYLLINKAQAYKWSGNQEKCNEVLDIEESQTWMLELRIPKLSLMGELDEVIKLMQQLGGQSKLLTISSYREWPVFKDLREHPRFEDTFNMVFKEELVKDETIKTINSNDSTSTNSYTIEVNPSPEEISELICN